MKMKVANNKYFSCSIKTMKKKPNLKTTRNVCDSNEPPEGPLSDIQHYTSPCGTFPAGVHTNSITPVAQHLKLVTSVAFDKSAEFVFR